MSEHELALWTKRTEGIPEMECLDGEMRMKILDPATRGMFSCVVGDRHDPDLYRKQARLWERWLREGSRHRMRAPVPELECTELIQAYRRAKGGRLSKPGLWYDRLDEALADCPISRLGPRRLTQAYQAFIDETECVQNTLSSYRAMVLSILRWGFERELVPVEVYQAATLLRPPKCKRASKPKPRVDPEQIDRMIELIEEPTVADLLRVMMLTGARFGEIRRMRMELIERPFSGPWIYRPDRHKGMTADGEVRRERLIYIGPKAGQIITRNALNPDDSWVFRNPVVHREGQPGRPPVQDFDRHGNRAHNHGSILPHLTAACERMGVDLIRVHQIRKAAATRIRSQYGLEAASVVLGHSSAAVTDQCYAMRDEEKAARVVAEMG